MTAGYRHKISVYHVENDEDDVVGGAQPTGTYAGSCWTRLTPVPTNLMFLEQGIEASVTFRGTVPYAIPVREKDEVVVVQPRNFHYFNTRFRIISVTDSSMHPSDSRAFQTIVIRRIDRARRV